MCAKHALSRSFLNGHFDERGTPRHVLVLHDRADERDRGTRLGRSTSILFWPLRFGLEAGIGASFERFCVSDRSRDL